MLDSHIESLTALQDGPAFLVYLSLSLSLFFPGVWEQPLQPNSVEKDAANFRSYGDSPTASECIYSRVNRYVLVTQNVHYDSTVYEVVS